MKNYIEVEHYYVDSDGAENWDVWHAVCPTRDRFRFAGRDKPNEFGSEGWKVEGGSPVLLYDKADVDALRKLLDEIEKEMDV